MLRPPAPYRLRAMTLDDIPAVLDIDRASFPSPAPEQLFVNELSSNRLAHYQVLSRDDDPPAERLLGFAGFWLIADEVHVSTIALAPELRGRGLGELLLLNLLNEALTLSPAVITLEVRETNLAAQALYAKYHFEVVGTRRRYYRDTGEDALLMTVQLDAHPDYGDWLEEARQSLYTRLATTA